jgi:hypothetical protein
MYIFVFYIESLIAGLLDVNYHDDFLILWRGLMFGIELLSAVMQCFFIDYNKA